MCVPFFISFHLLPSLFTLQTMYQGVIRDDERRKRKMKEREEDFLRSQQKRSKYESVQRVETIPPSDTPGP